MGSNLIVLADFRAAAEPTSTSGCRSRFPVTDDLGFYCWFCSGALDVAQAQPTEHPPGQGRYRVTCPDCRHGTCFDRSDELEDDA